MKAKIHIKYIDGTSREVEREFRSHLKLYGESLVVDFKDNPELIKEMIVKPIHDNENN